MIGNLTSEDLDGAKVEPQTTWGTVTSGWVSDIDHLFPNSAYSTFVKIDDHPAYQAVAQAGSVHFPRVSTFAKWAGVSVTKLSHDESVGLADAYSAMQMLYQWEHNRQGRIASAYAVYFVERNFSARNLAAVNDLLLNVSAERLTEWSMVAILRSSFSARSSLPAWPAFMAAVRERLKDNERLERLLVGLTR
jgi:hypothetical protein